MDISAALLALGVHEDTLSQEELEFLDREGYLPLRGILTPQQVAAINQRQAELLAEEGDRAGLEVHQEPGTDRLANLINKGTLFHIVLNHPRVLAAMAHVLEGDLKLTSLNSRAALPGQGLQALHPDWDCAVSPGNYQSCNSIWLLDDFTPENGATRVVPGSHRNGKMPREEMSDPTASHPDEMLLLGQAGDVIVFNCHTWHGGTRNRTTKPRRALHGAFTRRHNHAQTDQQQYLTPETREQLSEASRVVLGV